MRIVGAAAAGKQDWAVVLDSQGQVTLYRMGDLFATGAVSLAEDETEVLWFSVFSAPETEELV